MATTIITKNGSGAPLAGDLTAGELAVDLTNKRLYSKDSGGTVIELGTTPSAISGGTIDDTVIGGTTAAAGTFTDLTATSSFTSVGIDDNASSTAITIDSSQNVSLSGDLTVDTNTLYVDSTNNRVGIGTDSADELLEISSATGSTSIDPTVVRISTTTNAGTWTSDATWGALQFYNADTSDGGAKVHAQIAANTTSTTGGVSDIVFSSAAVTTGTLTERMRIDSDGNVGIGKTPTCALNVASDDYVKVVVEDVSGTDTPFSIGSGVNALTIANNASGDSADEAIALRPNDQSIAFTTAGSEAMRIDSSGNLLVGTTATASAAKLRIVGGSVRFDNLITADVTGSAANVYVTPSTGVLNRSTSSFRYKENIRDYDQSVSIDALRPVFFNSKNEADDKLYAGFISEEVAAAGFEEFVERGAEGQEEGVFYAHMVALLTKEIQELRARVAQLEGAN